MKLQGQRLRLLRGGMRNALCVWEPYEVRAMLEARALAANGCNHGPSAPSASMRALLLACSERFPDGLEARFERGRVLFMVGSPAASSSLRDVRAIATEFKLSSLDAAGTVRFCLRTDDFGAASAMVRVLSWGGACAATLREAGSRLVVRSAGDALVVSARRGHVRCTDGALKLLGFRCNVRGWYQLRLDAGPHGAARSLLHLLAQTSAPELEVTLAPPVITSALSRPPAPAGSDAEAVSTEGAVQHSDGNAGAADRGDSQRS